MMCANWSVIDKYSKHVNGRLWIIWEDRKVDLKVIKCSNQMIHCGMYNVECQFISWITAIYASNMLEERKSL